MSKTLLCGIELTASGIRTAEVASMFCRDLDLGLCLVHAFGGIPQPGEGASDAVVALAQRLEAEHDALLVDLERTKQLLEAKGARVTSARLVAGHPYEVLIEEARALDARFIAVGPHTRTPGAVSRALGRFLGSTADHVIRHTPCPVLVACGTQLSSLNGRVILVGLDGEPSSLRALTESMAIATEASASVEAIYVGDDAAVVDRAIAHARAHATSAHLAGVLTSIRKTPRDPGGISATVLDVARRTNAAMLAVGTAGRTGLARLVVGSVAEEICRHADTPVLVVRGSAR